MTRRKCSFTEADMRRALHAAKAAGVPVRIEIRDGNMVVTMVESAKAVRNRPTNNNDNEWDEVFKDGEG
jgi:monoamine oxidase